ncbi:MAG: leucine-rich repeat domain-containing protein, partial [Ruminococcus sp.]|nr:leucine-rich repeat domain-containing protein [Ruminococcus sp.]
TIGEKAFYGCISLKQVTIPQSVNVISSEAFRFCKALEKVTISKGVKEIGEKAFDSCSKLKQVTIPGSIEKIDNYALSWCEALEQVNILEGSRTVSADVLSAFLYCDNLSSVVVPNSVTEIETNAFRKIENLKTVYMLCDPAYLTWDFPDGNYILFNQSSSMEDMVDVYVPNKYLLGYITKYKLAGQNIKDANFIGAYNVNVSGLVTNGSVVADRFMAAQGETVHFTVTPNPSCIVKHVFVDGKEVANNSDGTYSFVMPAKDVSILAIIEPFDATHLYGHSISLDGDIGVNFYMELDQSILSSQTAYMQFDVPNGKKTETQIVYVKDVLNDPVTIGGRSYFKFKCQVAAKDMAAEIVAQLHDGNARGEEYKYSVREYAKYILDNSNDYSFEIVNLVKAMLNYGSAAQEYFLNESGSDLANHDLDTGYDAVDEVSAGDIDKPYDDRTCLLREGVTFEGVTLSLKSETTLSLYFKSKNEMTFDGCQNLETSSNYDADVERTGDYWVFRIRGISAKELDDRILLNLDVGQVRYCPLTYCYNVLNRNEGTPQLQKVCKALFLYNQAANEYFSED